MFVVIHRLVPWHDDLGQKMFTSKSKRMRGSKMVF